MNRIRPILIILLIAAAVFVAWRLLGGRTEPETPSGYIEAENLYLAAPQSGTLATISAVEGGRVAAGQALFTIDPATLSAQGEQARAGEVAARTQIASAAASAQQAQSEANAAAASAERARRDLARLEAVRRDDAAAVAGKDLDAARAALREANARVAAARDTANARRAQVDVARAQAAQAGGGTREVAIRVGQLSPAAPSNGRVQDVFYQRGEWVPANQPVVSLIPDDKVKLRFFVPEREVARYRPGRRVRFACDGCATGLIAVIRFVSARPEFTPPVIFSRDSRDTLVFMVEALPDKPAGLNPGLPVDVVPLP
jgi:HlyD family secretion protein